MIYCSSPNFPLFCLVETCWSTLNIAKSNVHAATNQDVATQWAQRNTTLWQRVLFVEYENWNIVRFRRDVFQRLDNVATSWQCCDSSWRCFGFHIQRIGHVVTTSGFVATLWQLQIRCVCPLGRTNIQYSDVTCVLLKNVLYVSILPLIGWCRS